MTGRPRGRRSAGLVGLLAAAVALVLAGCSAAALGVGPATHTPTGTATTATAPTTTGTPSSTTTTTATPTAVPQTPLPNLKVVGLGDSVMSGMACNCTPFLAQYAGLLAARDHRPVSQTNLGAPGLTAPGLVDQLSQPATSDAVSTAGTVVVTIGANDLVPLIAEWSGGGCTASCIQPAVRTMQRSVAQVLSRINAMVPDGTQVLVTDYWNVFQDGAVADAQQGDGFADWSDGVTVQANAAICSEAKTAGDTCVDLYHPFLGADGTDNPTPLLADDGDHPNAAGHALIAKALLAETPSPTT